MRVAREARATLRSVVRRLDVEGDQGNTQVHYLRYAKAEEVAEVLRGIAEGRERNQSGTTSTSTA